MFKSALRLATGSLLMSAALGAFAAPPHLLQSALEALPPVAAPGYQDLSLTGVFQETIVPTTKCPSGLSGNLGGYGGGTVLGRIAFLSSDCFTQNGPLFTFSQGKFMITTATGELVFADYSGQVVPTGEGTNGVMTGATFTITGGTGKYARATGGGALDGTEDLATGQGTIKMTGRILLKK
jgi:hypothetical protein